MPCADEHGDQTPVTDILRQISRSPQASLDYLLSDNPWPACGGRLLFEDFKLQPRDNNNISRSKSEAINLGQRVEELKTKIIEHGNSLYMKTTGKLQTGLRCHQKFNEDTLHFITTGIEKSIDNVIKDLGRVMTKISATFPILSSAKSPQYRKKKESSAKAKRRKIRATEARKNRAYIIFLSLGGSSINYDQERIKGTEKASHIHTLFHR